MQRARGASTRGISRDPVGVRGPLHGLAEEVRNRRGYPAPLVCLHTDGVPACSLRNAGNRAKPDTVEVSRSSPVPITSSSWRHRRRIADSNRSSATADWTRPNSHMESDAVTSPSPFGESCAAWPRKCAGDQRTRYARTSAEPKPRIVTLLGSTLRQNRRKPLRIAAFDWLSPDRSGLLTVDESTASGRVAGEPVTSAGTRGAGASTVLTATPGGCPSSQRLLSRAPLHRCR